jgi:RNA polymerase sigma-70 factor (ECF subfamily)
MDIEAVYTRHAEMVYRFFYIKCLDTATAEDLTSQTFMALLERSQADAAEVENTKKFVYGVMRNVWLMYLRKKYQRNEYATEDMDEFESYVEESIEEYTGLTAKQRAEIYINRLPTKQRDIVARRLLHEQSVAEIAAKLGKDSDYVKTTYKRGLRRLRRLIAEPELQTNEAPQRQEAL